MPFTMRRDSKDPCPKCQLGIGAGELAQWADADHKVLEHTDCDNTDGQGEEVIRWENVTEETLERTGLLEQEIARTAPLGKQGKCPKCNIELPKTRICGYCS